MVQCGGLMSALTGRHTAMVAGCMNLIGAGLGFRMIPGDGLRTTTAAGWWLMAAGVGGQVRCMEIRSTVQSGRRLMFRSSALAAGLESDLDLDTAGARSAGFRWGRVIISIRGMDDLVDASALPALTALTAAASHRCTAAIASRT